MYSVRGPDRSCTCHYDASYHNSANAKYAVGSIILGLDDCTCQRSAIGFCILFLRHKAQLYGWPWLYEKYANYRGKQGGALTTWLVSSRQCRKTFAYGNAGNDFYRSDSRVLYWTATKKCVCSRCFLYCHMVLELAAWYTFNACYSRSFSAYENFANLCGKRE